MVYEWTQLGIREITNLFLYGQPSTPADMADASRIRAPGPGNGAAVDVNMPSFMSTGPGRFALGSLSRLVQTFFRAEADRDWMETNRAYSMEEIKNELSNRRELLEPDKSEDFVIQQYTLADTTDDYRVRCYVWGTGRFRLSTSATFAKDANGNLRIDNYQIRAFDDNFDFEGKGDIAAKGNAILQPRIDPSRIGRTVSLIFNPNGLPTSTYTYSNYLRDQLLHAEHVTLGHLKAVAALFGGIDSITDELWNSGVTRTVHDGKPVFYGTVGNDVLAQSKIYALKPDVPLRTYAATVNGVVLVAGASHDVLIGG